MTTTKRFIVTEEQLDNLMIAAIWSGGMERRLITDGESCIQMSRRLLPKLKDLSFSFKECLELELPDWATNFHADDGQHGRWQEIPK